MYLMQCESVTYAPIAPEEPELRLSWFVVYDLTTQYRYMLCRFSVNYLMNNKYLILYILVN